MKIFKYIIIFLIFAFFYCQEKIQENMSCHIPINSLSYSNTQGEIGKKYSMKNSIKGDKMTLDEILKYDKIIKSPLTNDDSFTLNELDNLIKKQEQRNTIKLINVRREVYDFMDTFKIYMQKNNMSENHIKKQMDIVKKNSVYQYGPIVYILKKHYNRIRPSILMDKLNDCNIKEDKLIPWIKVPLHPSYPSGHATQGMYTAEILSYYDPDNKDIYMKAGKLIGYNRELAGLHYRSDTIAGFKLGKYLAQQQIKKSEEI